MEKKQVDKAGIISDLILQRLYIKIQFFNRFHEFHTVYSLVKSSAVDSIELASGEVIDIQSIVSLNEKVMPEYSHIIDFTCDC